MKEKELHSSGSMNRKRQSGVNHEPSLHLESQEDNEKNLKVYLVQARVQQTGQRRGRFYVLIDS